MNNETAVSQDLEFTECTVATDVDDSQTTECAEKVYDLTVPEIKQEALHPDFKEKFDNQCDRYDTGNLCTIVEVR